jgi:polar amino acid transport system substrate-binding protein
MGPRTRLHHPVGKENLAVGIVCVNPTFVDTLVDDTDQLLTTGSLAVDPDRTIERMDASMKKRSLRLSLAIAGATAAVLVAVTGCSTTPSATSSSSASVSPAKKLANSCNCLGEVKVDTTARDLLPSSIKASGELNAGFNAPSPPFWYISTNGTTTYSGVEYDMIQALGKTLGLKVKLTNQAWDGLMPALIADRYDVIISNIGDKPERRTNINFVDYGKTATGLLVLAQNAGKYHTAADMCGTTVGAQTGALQVGLVAQISAATCPADKPITVKALSDLKGLFPALLSGQVASIVLDSPAVGYWAGLKQKGAPKYAAPLNGLGTYLEYGLGTNNKDPQLAKALQAALVALNKSGIYKKIWDAGNIGNLTIDKFTINGKPGL